jgi:hypothetical protein
LPHCGGQLYYFKYAKKPANLPVLLTSEKIKQKQYDLANVKKNRPETGRLFQNLFSTLFF